MPRVNKPKAHRVIITEHFWERFQERSPVKMKRTKLEKMMTAKLNNALAVGLYLDDTGAGWIEVFPPWFWATVRITDHGWLVITFTDWREEAAG